MTPRVTVLLAVRDGEPYLAEAIESVLGQTFTDFELLVVDDASGDGTPQLLASIVDDRLRVLRNDANLGQVASLNRGLREARGAYIARVDHDDVCRADRLERQVAVLDATPGVAVVGSWATLVDDGGHVLGRVRQSIRDYVDFVYWNLVAWVLIPHPAAMFRRDVVLELGGYDEALGPSEDKDLWRKLALARLEGRIVEDELIRYRLHAAQLSYVFEERQRLHDEQSHVAFLQALAGDAAVDAERLRRLLIADPRLFREEDPAAALRDLDLLLDAAAVSLRLSRDERTRLLRLVRARVAAAARDGWRGGVLPWWRSSLPLAVYGARRGGWKAAADAAAYALMLPASPLARVTERAARRAGEAAVASRALQRIERPASRSPIARRVYSWLINRP